MINIGSSDEREPNKQREHNQTNKMGEDQLHRRFDGVGLRPHLVSSRTRKMRKHRRVIVTERKLKNRKEPSFF